MRQRKYFCFSFHEGAHMDVKISPLLNKSADSTSTNDEFPSTKKSRVKQIWAVGGGKGGIGKSLLASNLAIALSRFGNTVTAIDLDLGGANLHTTLGVDLPKKSLSDFISNRTVSLKDCEVPSGLPRLKLISGAQDAVNVTQITQEQKSSLIQQARELDSDYLIFDLGAGTSSYTMDFFLEADIGVIALLPEPTCIENCYRFIKTAYYTKLLKAKTLADIRPLIELATDAENKQGIKSPSDLFREVNRQNPEAAMRLKKEISLFQPQLVLNQARTQTDVEIGNSVKAVCKRYFGVEMDYIGHLDYDSSVWQAVRRKRPLMIEFPNSKLVATIDRMVQYLLKRYGKNGL
jgi:flagellar biosynthesis protein FlhG